MLDRRRCVLLLISGFIVGFALVVPLDPPASGRVVSTRVHALLPAGPAVQKPRAPELGAAALGALELSQEAVPSPAVEPGVRPSF